MNAPPSKPPLLDESPDTIPAQREILFKNMESQLGLSVEVMDKTRNIFMGSRWMGQGNPKVTKHPMTRSECLDVRAKHTFHPADERCGAPNMVAVFNPGFFAVYRTPTGQLILISLLAMYVGSLVLMRRKARQRPRARILLAPQQSGRST